MSETPLNDDQNKKNEDHFDDNAFLKRVRKGAAATMGFVGAVGVGLGGVAANETIQATSAQAVIDADKAAAQEKADALKKKFDATYSIEDTVGQFEVSEGSTLQQGVEGVLDGTIRSDDYDTFLASARNIGTVQSGDVVYVVQKDVDGNTDNGDETFVVKPAQVNHGQVTELPTPETH